MLFLFLCCICCIPILFHPFQDHLFWGFLFFDQGLILSVQVPILFFVQSPFISVQSNHIGLLLSIRGATLNNLSCYSPYARGFWCESNNLSLSFSLNILLSQLQSLLFFPTDETNRASSLTFCLVIKKSHLIP